MMRRLFALFMLLLAGPAVAQVPATGFPAIVRPLPYPVPQRPVLVQPGPYGAWRPTADYVTAGQDEPGYRRWVASRPWRSATVSGFHQYLATYGVAYVVPTWQLLRTASDWQRCGAEPFEIPPSSEWPNLVGALRYIQSYVVPAIGPVEAVSVYRNPALNACAGGAPESAHRHMFAIDMVPLRPTSRTAMIDRLCTAHAYQGGRYAVGLGFYTKLRFHVDTWKFRRWGRDDNGGSACSPTLARLNIQERPSVPAASVTSAASGSVGVNTGAFQPSLSRSLAGPSSPPAVSSAPSMPRKDPVLSRPVDPLAPIR